MILILILIVSVTSVCCLLNWLINIFKKTFNQIEDSTDEPLNTIRTDFNIKSFDKNNN